MDFNAFVDHYGENIRLRPQANLILNGQGETEVNFVGRFENLHEDFNSVCDMLSFSAQLPHKNSTAKADYRKTYSQRSIDTVARAYADDIKYFKYQFE